MILNTVTQGYIKCKSIISLNGIFFPAIIYPYFSLYSPFLEPFFFYLPPSISPSFHFYNHSILQNGMKMWFTHLFGEWILSLKEKHVLWWSLNKFLMGRGAKNDFQEFKHLFCALDENFALHKPKSWLCPW